MVNNFRQQAAKQRAAVPQVDPQGTSPLMPTIKPQPAPIEPTQTPNEPGIQTPQPLASAPVPQHHITMVDTSEAPVNRGFFMYPSRHRQIAKDLVYIEDRKPWQIIEDALEEYVVKHYGKEYKRT